METTKATGWKTINGLCVPASTPDNYFQQSAREWLKRQTILKACAQASREAELQRIEARFELESDEFYTAREKAVRIRDQQ